MRVTIPLLLMLLGVSFLVGCNGDKESLNVTDGIVFMYENNDIDALMLMNPDGSNQRAIPGENDQVQGTLSPDGRKIAFIEDYNNVVLYDIASGTRETLHSGIYMAIFSPDGKKIAFSDENDSDELAVWVMNVDGSNAHIIYETPGNDIVPMSWSPNGSMLACQTDSPSNQVITLINATDGSVIAPLTSEGKNIHPWFMRNGKILFTHTDSAVGARSDIWIMNNDGTNKRNLTNSPTVNEAFPSSNRAGNKIAYGVHSTTPTHIEVADFDGNTLSNPVNITANSAVDCWRPAFGMIAK